MPSDRVSMASINSSAYAWSQEFFDRQIQKYPAENLLAVTKFSSVVDLIKKFLSASGDMEAFLGPSTYHMLELEPFCTSCSMDDLIIGTDPRVTRPMALLDDRCRRMHHSEPPGGHMRRNRGPLSSSQLLRELRKNVSHRKAWPLGILTNYDNCSGTDALVRMTLRGDYCEAFSIIRRLLHLLTIIPSYVANPDCCAIVALASTASSVQAAFLADFFYKYLGSRTSLGIHRPMRGPLIFGLEFHLQFYVWCEGGPQFRDFRKKRNGKPLRQSRQPYYLKLGDENEPQVHIYETQVSCLIAGIDEDSWVAYQFVDTYYQGEKPLAQDEEHGVKPDPLTGGLFDANLPIWTPREYFLIVYECRLKQVRHAMHNLVARLFLRLEPYVSGPR